MEEVVSRLGSLSSAELEQLSAKVAALRALSGPAPSTPRDGAGIAVEAAFGELLYSALSEALSAEQGVTQQPYAVFLRTKAGAPFLRGIEAAQRAHTQWFPNASRSETAALSRIYARSVLEYIKAHSLAANWRTVSFKLQDLPDALDCAFPGYVRSGLVAMIACQQERHV